MPDYECLECGQTFTADYENGCPQCGGVCAPDFGKMPREQLDAELRKLGYDPEKVGYTGAIFTNVLIENVKLKEQLAHAEGTINNQEAVLHPYRAEVEQLRAQLAAANEDAAFLYNVVARINSNDPDHIPDAGIWCEDADEAMKKHRDRVKKYNKI